MWLNYYHLLLTIAVEYLVILLIFRKKPLKLLIFIILINCFTWPLANRLYIYLTDYNVYPFIITELLVFLFEWILIKLLFQIESKKALALSFAANLVTGILSFIVPLYV